MIIDIIRTNKVEISARAVGNSRAIGSFGCRDNRVIVYSNYC